MLVVLHEAHYIFLQPSDVRRKGVLTGSSLRRDGAWPVREINEHSLLIPSREQVSCPMEDDTAILNLKDGEYYELNAVGSRVWELIREPRTFGALHAQMLDEFDVEAEPLRQDLLELLDAMAEKGLVEIRAQESA